MAHPPLGQQIVLAVWFHDLSPKKYLFEVKEPLSPAIAEHAGSLVYAVAGPVNVVTRAMIAGLAGDVG